MSIIVLQLFVGLVLVAAAVILLAYSLRSADHEHLERLSLMPIEGDKAADANPASSPAGRNHCAAGDGRTEP